MLIWWPAWRSRRYSRYILQRLAVHMEKIEALKRKGQRAMIYPAIVMSVAVIVVVVLLVFVYPYLREMVF